MDWTTGWSEFDHRQRQRIFPLNSVSRRALISTQHPIQWVPGVLFPGVKRGRGVTLTTHPHLVPRSRMSRSHTPFPPSAPMECSGNCFTFTFYWFRPYVVIISSLLMHASCKVETYTEENYQNGCWTDNMWNNIWNHAVWQDVNTRCLIENYQCVLFPLLTACCVWLMNYTSLLHYDIR
jgi:hypothetical protein